MGIIIGTEGRREREREGMKRWKVRMITGGLQMRGRGRECEKEILRSKFGEGNVEG